MRQRIGARSMGIRFLRELNNLAICRRVPIVLFRGTLISTNPRRWYKKFAANQGAPCRLSCIELVWPVVSLERGRRHNMLAWSLTSWRLLNNACKRYPSRKHRLHKSPTSQQPLHLHQRSRSQMRQPLLHPALRLLPHRPLRHRARHYLLHLCRQPVHRRMR